MKSTKSLWIVLSVLLFCNSASATGGGCQLKRGLFERRLALAASGAAYGGEASESTPASKELEVIDEQYFQFMLRVSNAENQQGTDLECCKDSTQDPVARIVCKFAKYLRTGKKDHRLLLDSVPTDPTGREALWALEPIAFFHDEHNPEDIPALFKPYGPVTLFLDELCQLVRLGDREALSKYLELYPYSDGEHAEEMDDQLLKLLRSHLGTVLSEWDVFRDHRKALLKFMAFLPSDEKKVLRSKIHANKECTLRSAACSELKALLSIETPLRE
jgi:hypothetical protein